MNFLDKQYQELLFDIIENGVDKNTRNGKTRSVFGKQIRHKMKEGFPLLTTKKMAWKTMVTELIWFLRGDTNIKFLVDNNCHIWDGDAYKKFKNQFDWLGETNHLRPNEFFNDNNEILSKEEFINKIKTDDEFAEEWGELGPIYGTQWRSWEGLNSNTDQIQNLINDLKTNPDSRRLMVNAWNVGELDSMVLPPCHYGFQVYTRELSLEERKQIFEDKGYVCDLWPFNGDWHGEYDGFGISRRAISLMWNQRSVDTFLGLPFNIASYGLLLEIIAKEVNMVPDELIGNLGDTHLYLNHIEQAKEQIGRELSESERYRIFEDRGYEFRMVKDWSKEEQYDKAGIPTQTREPYPLPKLHLKKEVLTNIFSQETIGRDSWNVINVEDFMLENYQSHPTIKAPLSN